MAIKRMTLESVYNKAKAEYASKGYGTDSWQWNDEGKIYAIQDYLSSCGELDEADWAFAKSEGIEAECQYELEVEKK